MVTCVKLASWRDFASLLKEKDNDFWVSSLADVTAREFPDRVLTMRVEEALVCESFSKCYYAPSVDIKAEADALTATVGLGLRRKTVRSRNVPGCIFALVQDRGPSGITKKRGHLDACDKRLPTGERVRRTEMRMEVVSSLDRVMDEARQSPRNFFLTAFSDVSPEDAKKKAVCYMVEGEQASTIFNRAVIVEVQDCSMANSRFTSQFGLGLRKSHVRSKPRPGSMVLFFWRAAQTEKVADTAASTPVKSKASPSEGAAGDGSSRSGRGSAQEEQLTPAKRRRTEGQHQKAGVGSSASELQVCLLPTKEARGGVQPESKYAAAGRSCADGVAQMEGLQQEDESEEVYIRQVRVLEKRLEQLLPTLPQEDLSTSLVQGRLEQHMQLMPGRLAKFRMEIFRIWRAYLECMKCNGAVPDID